MNSYVNAAARLSQERDLLKIMCAALTGLCLILSLTTYRQLLKSPLVIERGALGERGLESRVVQIADGVPSAIEIESFVKVALAARFDTDSKDTSDLLSLAVIDERSSEMAELKKREIKQKLILNSLSSSTDLKSGNTLIADTDRLLSVGAIRSAFSFPLTLKIERTERTRANPYGLVLTEVRQMTQAAQSPSPVPSPTNRSEDHHS